jgi:hypothetical protein
LSVRLAGLYLMSAGFNTSYYHFAQMRYRTVPHASLRPIGHASQCTFAMDSETINSAGQALSCIALSLSEKIFFEQPLAEFDLLAAS